MGGLFFKKESFLLNRLIPPINTASVSREYGTFLPGRMVDFPYDLFNRRNAFYL